MKGRWTCGAAEQHTAGGDAAAEGKQPGSSNANADWIGFDGWMDGWMDGLMVWSLLCSLAAGGPVAPSQGEAQIQSD